MSDTTPTAAVAAPVAAPAAPAPATTPAPAAPAAAPPAAPAVAAAPASAAPAAPAAAPAAAAAVDDSLIPADPAAPAPTPQTDAEKLEAAKALVKAAEEAADPNGGKAWLLADGVMGQGPKPDWLKSDKYKNVVEQAKAYTALEGRFGAFKGAPAEGKYSFTPPEGVEVQMDHPLMQAFTNWAKESQLSQEGYTNLLGMLVQYEAAHQPDMAAIKAKLGENADARISQVAQWGKANLTPEGFSTLRAATAGQNADAVFQVLEQVIAKTAQVRMPKPGEDVPGAQPGAGLESIKDAHGKRNDKGQLLADVDPKYRAEIERRYRDYFASQAA